QYDIADKFIEYIIKDYVFTKLSLLDKLLEFKNIRDKIEKKCETGDWKTCDTYYWQSNEQLLYISKHIPIRKLNLYCNANITDDGIKNLTNIHTLDLSSSDTITDEGIKKLTNIHTL